MADGPNEFEMLMAALAGDPAFAGVAKPGSGVLVWDAAVDRIVGASRAAAALAGALTDETGRVEAGFPARVRLKALADGLAPTRGMRLERLRLDPARLASPVTCACRRAILASGEAVLVTAIVGPVPKVAPRPRPGPGREGRAPTFPSTAGSAPARFRPSGTVRFVWQADAETRFTQVSPALADVVGPMAGDIVGLTWADLARSAVADTGGVAARFARRETFSGRMVHWSVDNTNLEIPVDWAGMPIFGPDRTLVGFRGFGLIRTEATRERGAPAASDRAETMLPAAGSPTDREVMNPAAVAIAPEVTGPSRDGSGEAPGGPGVQADEPALAGSEPPADGPAVETVDLHRDAAVLDRVHAPELHSGAGKTGETDGGSAAPAAVPAEGDDGEAEVYPQRGTADQDDDGAEVAAAPAAGEDGAESDDTWFAGFRERVTATLSGAKAAILPAQSSEAPLAAARPSKSSETQHGLSSAERSAFREIARALGARFEDEEPAGARPPHATEPRPAPPSARAAMAEQVLDGLPGGVIVHRDGRILFANRVLLELVDYDDLGQIGMDGGMARLFRGSPTLLRSDQGGSAITLTTRRNESIAVDVRVSTVDWNGVPASLMLVRRDAEADARDRLHVAEAELRLAQVRVRELESVLDTATDGVIVVDETARILSLNCSAEALFGYDQREVVGDTVTVLLAPESHIVALDYIEGLRSSGVASLLNDGREVMGRVRQGGTIPLFMTMGRVNDGPDRKFCAVLRDITAFKKAEGELMAAKRAAEEANAQKSDLLAKISHEIRTPLNAIIGFAEVMLEERFGPVGNERYKDYLKDVHASGAHVISLVNDLLDLAKIEAGRMELSYASVSLNDLVGATVALLQPQAARDRIVMRTSFAPRLPAVVADERSVRQIVLNLVSNAIKFTDAGGQVIVSTALTDRGEVAFRVRDTGIGMTEEEIEAALEPFRQLATARRRGGTGLGLPLTKALVEANRGALRLSSNPNEGTLVEVLFPPMRVLAE